MNRNINKLKKIYQSCGINCTKSTNGQIIDDLCALAENGQLGSGESESVLEYLYYYNVGDSEAFYSFDRIEDTGLYEGYFVGNNYVYTRKVNIVSFNEGGAPVDDEGYVYGRSYKRDAYKKPPKDELVRVEFVGGYSGLLSGSYYNFATNSDSYGNTYTNQRIGSGGSGYCEMENCDLAIYIGSGRIGHYRIVQ